MSEDMPELPHRILITQKEASHFAPKHMQKIVGGMYNYVPENKVTAQVENLTAQNKMLAACVNDLHDKLNPYSDITNLLLKQHSEAITLAKEILTPAEKD